MLLTRAAIALLTLTALMPPAAALAQHDADRARTLFNQLANKEFDSFRAACTDKMRSALPDQALASLWTQIQFQLGTFENVTHVESDPPNFTVSAKFDRGNLKLRFVFDPEARLAGLWVDEIAPRTPYKYPAYVATDRFTERDLVVQCGEYKLPATLTTPNGTGPFPAVVLVHGSGAHDRDETIGPNKPFKDLAGGLATRGIAVLRYEKRNKAYAAKLDPNQITLATETIEDAVAAAQLAAAQPEIADARVFIAGHSLGAFATPFILAAHQPIAGGIMIAAPARPATASIRDQVRYINRLDDQVSPEERAAEAQLERAITAIERDEPTTEQLLGAPAAYWRDLLIHDVLAATRAARQPLLILHGGRDYQVTDRDYTRWRELARTTDRITLKQFKALNHLMIAGSGRSTPDEYMRPGHVDREVVDAIAEWISRKKPTTNSP